MKHHHYPAALVLSITLVLFFFVVTIASFDIPDQNIRGLASEQSICSVMKYCSDWDWNDIEKYGCKSHEIRESKICVSYDKFMNCVGWASEPIFDCEEFFEEVVWEKSCLEWSEKEVCE